MHYISDLFDKVLYRPTVHQENLNTVYTQKVFVMLVLLAFSSVVRMTTLADAKRTSMENTYCVYTVLRFS